MASWGEVDFSELVALRDKLQNVQNVIDRFYLEATQEIAQILLANAKQRTPPPITGNLENGWTSEVKKEGSNYIVEVINPVEYAEYVEFGHRKRNGKGWVQGKFMLTIAERDIQRNLDHIIQKKLEQFVAGALEQW